MSWEYIVVNLNVEKGDTNKLEPSNPNEASEKLKGALSAEFIMEQFPDQYKEKELPKHPAIMLSQFLNKKGEQGWELCETVKLENLSFLIMKRKIE